MPFDWEQYIEPYNYETVAQNKSGFWGSLWETTKSATSQVFQSGVDVYKQYIDVRYPANQGALVYRAPTQSLPPSPNFIMSTPYQRDTNKATPSTTVIGLQVYHNKRNS